MGWTVEHLPQNVTTTAVDGILDDLKGVVEYAAWRAMRPLYEGTASGRPFTLSTSQAQVVADVLDQAVEWLAPQTRRTVRQLAAAAHTATESGRPWKWS